MHQPPAPEMLLSQLSNTYSSSGVRWTGSPVNSGGKLARSRSESNRGLNGGDTCFCSSYTSSSGCNETRIFATTSGNRKAKEHTKQKKLVIKSDTVGKGIQLSTTTTTNLSVQLRRLAGFRNPRSAGTSGTEVVHAHKLR